MKYQFNNTSNREFVKTLTTRVNSYFKENKLQKTGGWRSVTKAIIVITTYMLLYFAIVAGGFEHVGLLFALWCLLGANAAIMGTAVMHDALHGTLSSNKRLNNILGFSAPFLGISAEMWKFQHNVLHHNYTNIQDLDTDIDTGSIFRFSPHQERKWYHRFQPFYANFLYGLMTLAWVIWKDFSSLSDYKKRGMFKNEKEVKRELWGNIAYKLAYFGIFLVIPIITLSVPFWLTILMFCAMHFVCGHYLAIVFQTAHVMPEAKFEKIDENASQENWFVHQILTTANFAPKNKMLSWILGGLNYQIEHHLFPNISHIHYPKLSKIVKQTTQEFNLPYYSHNTFFKAIVEHFRHLNVLGKPVPVRVN
ncbi:MAG: fatty acid desaturase family protein [Luteibaculum sp.]